MRNRLCLVLVLAVLVGAPLPARGQPAGLPVGEPDGPSVRDLLGSGHAKLGKNDVDGAIADFTEALRRDPRNVYAHNLLGFIHQSQTGDFDKAIGHFEMVVSESPDARQKAYALTQIGSILFAEKSDAAGALERYKQAYKTYPLSQTCYVTSSLHHLQRNDDDALRFAEHALKLAAKEAKAAGAEAPEPGYAARLAVQKAVALLTLKRKDEALALVQDLAEERPAAYNLAQLHALLGDLDSALAHLGVAFELRQTPRARNQLRTFIERDKDFDALREDPALVKMLVREAE